MLQGLLKSWWVSSDLGRRGTGKGEPRCPQLAAAGAAAGSSTAPQAQPRDAGHRDALRLKASVPGTPHFEAKNPFALLYWCP